MSDEEFTGLGFAPGSVQGIRSFDVDKYGRLTGIHYKQVWKPGENEAECRKRNDEDMFMFRSAYTSIMGGTGSFTYSFNPAPPAAPTPPTPAVPKPNFIDRFFAPSVSGYVPEAPPAPAPPEPPKPVHQLVKCTCGFYGYFDGSDDYHDEGRITAVVEAYGETVIGTRGFRAMKARIIALRVKPEDDGIKGAMARKISNNYKGVAIFDSFAAMISEFPPDTSLEPSPETDPDFWTRT